MAFNIDLFRGQMVGDGARPNLFSVTLHFPTIVSAQLASAKLSFTAKAAQLPASTIGTARQSYFGREVKFPGDRVFQPWSIQIINDEDFSVRNAMEKWSNLLNHHEFNVRDISALNGLNYTADATVTQFSKVGTPIKEYKFVGMFPSVSDPINLNWGANDQIEEFGVTFEYQYWTSASTQGGGLGSLIGTATEAAGLL